MCKVRDRFHPEGSDDQGDGQITLVWFYIIYKFKIHCSQLVFIIEILYEPNLYHLILWVRRKRSHLFFLSGLNYFRS